MSQLLLFQTVGKCLELVVPPEDEQVKETSVRTVGKYIMKKETY